MTPREYDSGVCISAIAEIRQHLLAIEGLCDEALARSVDPAAVRALRDLAARAGLDEVAALLAREQARAAELEREAA